MTAFDITLIIDYRAAELRVLRAKIAEIKRKLEEAEL